MKTVSLIIPTCNMADYIKPLWESLRTSGALDRSLEVVFVNDGSTDTTNEVIQSIGDTKITLVDLGQNQGRFIARHRGAEAAKGTHLLFLDTRVALIAHFGKNLDELLKSHDALMGTVHIDIAKSAYNLYWQRSHETIFKKHYKAAHHGFYLTPENYEAYLKGTTVFLCPRSDFLNACEKYRDRPLHSDDTFLMREIVKTTPIWVDDKLAIDWEPRQGYWPFLVRLFERGPKFAEYHVFERKGLYFFLFLAWTLTVFSTVLLLVIRPCVGGWLLFGGMSILALSTAVFSRSMKEFFVLIPLHVGTILAYGLGAIYGVGVNLNWFKKPAPTAAKKS